MATPTPGNQLVAVPPKGVGKEGDNDVPLPSFRTMMGTQMVDINVGKGNSKAHFRVHKAILCAKVPYFDKMFNSRFEEATKNQANFPEDTPQSFNLLMLWVYNNNLPRLTVTKQTGGNLMNWIPEQLYILADKMCLPELMDIIATLYIKAENEGKMLPTTSYLGMLVEKLPEHTAFQKYAAHCLHYILHGLSQTPSHLKTWSVNDLNDVMASHPSLTLEYLRLVREHPRNIPVPDPRLPPYCKFHQHASDAPCPDDAASKTT